MRLDGVLPYLLPIVALSDSAPTEAASLVLSPNANRMALGAKGGSAASLGNRPYRDIVEIHVSKGRCKGSQTAQAPRMAIPKHSICHHKRQQLTSRLNNPQYPTSYKLKIKNSLRGLDHQHQQGACPCLQKPYYGVPKMPKIKSQLQRQLYAQEMLLKNDLKHSRFPKQKRHQWQSRIRGLKKQQCFHAQYKAHQTQNKFERKLKTLQSQLQELNRMIKSSAVTHEMRSLMKRYLDRLQKKISKVSMRAQLERQQSELYVALLNPSLSNTMRQALKSQLEMLRKRIAQLNQRTLVGVDQKRMRIKQHIKELERMLTSKALSSPARRELNSHLKKLHQQLMLLERQAVMEHQRTKIMEMLQQDNLNAIMRDALNMQLKTINGQIHRLTHKPKKVSPAQKRQKVLMQQEKSLMLLYNDPNTAPNMRKALKQQIDVLKNQTKQISKQCSIQKQMKELETMLKSPSCSGSMRHALQSQMSQLKKQMKLAKAPCPIRKLKKVVKKGVKRTKKGVKKGIKKVSRGIKKVTRRAKKGIKKIFRAPKRGIKKVKRMTPKSTLRRPKPIKATKKSVRRIGKGLKKIVKGTAKTAKKAVRGTAKTAKKVVKGTAKTAKKAVRGTAKTAKKVVRGTAKTAKKAVRGTAKTAKKVFRGTAKTAKKVVRGTAKTAKKAVKGTAKAAKKMVKGLGRALSIRAPRKKAGFAPKAIKKAGRKVRKTGKKIRKANKKMAKRNDSYSSDSDDDFF